MSDEHDTGSKSGGGEFSSLGIVFAMLGVVFFLTMDNSLVGLPFFVLGVVFFCSGFNAFHRRVSTWKEE